MSNIDAVAHAGAVPVTKSDGTPDPNGPFAGLFVFTAGNLSFADSKGQPVGTTGAPLAVQYGYIPIRCIRVNATGTTAVVYGLQALP